MNGRVRRIIQTGNTASKFNQDHPSTDPGYVNAAAKLDGLLVRASATATAQRDGLVAERAASARKQELRQGILAGPIPHMATVGRLGAREEPALVNAFTLKLGAGTYLGLLTAGRSMAAAATAHTEVLVKHGLAVPVLEELVRLLNQLDEATVLGHQARTAHAGATRELDTLATEIARTVRVMDGWNRQRFRDDSQLLGSWINASTVLGTPRPVSTPKDEPATPPTAGDVRPAA